MTAITSSACAAFRARAHRFGHRQRPPRRARRSLCDQFLCGRMALACRPRSSVGRLARTRRARARAECVLRARFRARRRGGVRPRCRRGAGVVGDERRASCSVFFRRSAKSAPLRVRLPVLVGWTHPYAPLGTPLVERDAAEPVIAAWLAHVAGDPSLPGLVLLPLRDRGRAVRGGARRDPAARADAGCRFRSPPARAAGAGRRSRAISNTRSRRTGSANCAAPRGVWPIWARCCSPPPRSRHAVAEAIDDFFALEASGWKGEGRHRGGARRSPQASSGRRSLALAREGNVAINRILLDGRAIAAAITLRSGDTAWYWKTAYDEALAR